MITEENARKQPLGVAQIVMLRNFKVISEDRWKGFIPTRSGEPWPLMKILMRRGLMAVKKQRCCYWHPKDGWEKEIKYDYYAAVTVAGEIALATLANK